MKSYYFLLLCALVLFSCSENKPEKPSEQPKTSEDVSDSKTQGAKNLLGYFKEERDLSDTHVISLLKLIDRKMPNVEVKSGNSKETEYTTMYLGKLNVDGERMEVFRQFYTVQAAIQQHGHSELVLITKKRALFYEMEELPVALTDNTFQFETTEGSLTMQLEHMTDSEVVFGKK